MSFFFNRNALTTAIALSTATLSGLVSAQDNAPSTTATLMEEIVVSARGIEEGLQDAPIAVSAFTGETLDYRGVDSLDQIERFVPSLTLQNNPSFGGASNSAAIYLRGVGQKEFLPTTEPGVGLYVDGVYVARSVGAILDIIDIDRLEVLRGPQGTLFGRNTIGGAISIATRKPQPGGDFGGSLAAAAGTDSLVHLRGTVHVPVNERVALRASVASMTQDGYVDRADGIDLGNDDTIAGRVSLAFQPNDDFAALITVDMTRDRENGPAMELLGIDFTDLSQLQGVVLAPPPPMAFIHNVTTAAMGPGQPCAATDPAGNGITSNPASPNCYDSRYIGADKSNEGTAPAYSETDVFGLSATLDYNLSENLAIKSITAYRELDSDFARDGDHSPHRIAQFEDTLEQDQFTQELQLLGTYDRMNWILGLYYFSEDGDNVNTLDFTVSNFRSGGAFDNTSWAAFAQATYDMTDRLHLTLGARYTDEDKAFTPDQIIYNNYFAGFSNLVPPGNPLAALDAPFLQAGSRILPLLEKEISISEFTPMANLAFDLSDKVMLYATYSEGFKSGGFTQRVFPPIVAGFTAPPGTPDLDLIPTYEPEFVDVLEAGFKMDLLDGQLRLNGAFFKTNYEELQVQVFNSVAPVTQNIGEASIEGFELELSASPAEGWFIEGSLSLLNAEYDTIDTANTLIFESNEFERVPETTASLGLSKEFSLSNAGTFLLRADWSYRSETFNDAYNTPLLETDSYSLIDASARWTNRDGDWTVIVSGTNLSDEEYLVTGVYGTAFQSLEGVYNRGRQWRVEVRKQF
ncbi:MAG: TonB-dependent receptor [Luminiphilus sp.]|nr:TonB-dependent receptor [Luminiphilus sp.]MDG1683488.1 TonB-dependent receptor [Luminiphilus sp.]MDG2135781.1 TonB-dependent receptor [Luminiphilus sp.]